MIFRTSEIPGYKVKLKRRFRQMMVIFLKFKFMLRAAIVITRSRCQKS
jgi:hypothetical protein